MSRTVLLGMNNPQSANPRYALYPHPSGCAGHRLMVMLVAAAERAGVDSLSPADYKEGFEKMNLLDSVEWSVASARKRVHEVVDHLRGRRVIMCGATVPKIVGVHCDQWCTWDTAYSSIDRELFEFCVIPHPSGRCRVYNTPEMREEVGDLLLAEYRRGLPERTV